VAAAPAAAAAAEHTALASAAAELRRLLLGLLLLRSRLPVLPLLPPQLLEACRDGLLTLPPLSECSLS
jgi:hypothetical protein